MSKYDQITGWFTDHWVTALLVVLVLVISAVPPFRDGVVLLYQWAKRPFQKSKRVTASEDIVLDVMGERITFTEILRSATHDVVIVHAHTHGLGVEAEYEWIRRRYPNSDTQGQALTTLQMMAGESKYDHDQVHFDIITIKTEQGHEKEICFDISSFFGGGSSTTLNPHEFLGKKLMTIYRDRGANKALHATSGSAPGASPESHEG